MKVTLESGQTHLSNLQQEGNTEGPKDFFVKMCNWNQHFTLFVQVHLVQGDLLHTDRRPDKLVVHVNGKLVKTR